MHRLKRILSTSFNTLIATLILILMLAIVTMWLSSVDVNRHGLNRIHSSEDGYQRQSNGLWMTIEGDEFTSADGIAQVNRVQMNGTIWFGTSGEKTWRIAHTGNVTVSIDGTVIFEVTGFNALRSDEITFTIDNAEADIDIDAIIDINTPRTVYPYRTEFGIYEQATFGRWSLIPSYRLYQSSTNEHIANSATLRYFAFQFSLIITILCILGLVGVTIRTLNLSLNRDMLMAIGITVISLMMRFIVMGERFYNDLFFHFIVPAGDDNYVLMGQQLLSGDYHLAGTFWPPAPIVWFAGIVALMGPQLWKIVIANILLSGLATAAVTVGAWQAFEKRKIGIMSGLIFALYPPLIFYQVTPQSVVLDAALVSFALMFGVLAIKHESYRYAAIFGIMISLGGMSRGIALLLGLALFIALLAKKPIQGIRLTTIAAIFAILTLVPQDWANYRATGKLSLVPYSNGQLTLYSGNNRDADGLWTGRGAAWEIERLTGQDWTKALLHDFQQDPLRMLELNLRKLSMFWNNFEYVSNVNYEQQGIGKSHLIAALSQNGFVGMAVLSFFVWIGMLHLITERKRQSHFIFWSINMLIFGTILFVLAGRLRVPVMPFLVVTAAVGISSIWDAISERKLSKRLIVGIGIAIGLSLLFPFLDANLPRKSYVSLPESAIQRSYDFNNELRLVGFDPIETNYAENGYFYISLYWEILEQPSYDYRVIVELADENGRITGVDRELGSITYPPLTASDLRVGGIIQEGYLIQLPDNLPDFASVNIGIYTDETDDLLVAPDGQLVETPLVRLFDVSFRGSNVDIDRFLGQQGISYSIGNEREFFTLSFESIAPYINEDNQVIVEIIWGANQQIYEDYVIFIQILDENGELIMQSDSPYLDDRRTTSSIRGPYYSLTRQISLPDEIAASTYQVILGAYEFPSLDRLPIINLDTGEALLNNVIPLGEITIER